MSNDEITQQRLQGKLARAHERNGTITGTEVLCDEKYSVDLENFKREVAEIETLFSSLNQLNPDVFSETVISLHSKLEELRETYKSKRAIAKYTMYYIQNLEVILQSTIKLFNLKQQ